MVSDFRYAGMESIGYKKKLTMACSAKERISLIARGARFLKLTPCTYKVKKRR